MLFATGGSHSCNHECPRPRKFAAFASEYCISTGLELLFEETAPNNGTRMSAFCL